MWRSFLGMPIRDVKRRKNRSFLLTGDGRAQTKRPEGLAAPRPDLLLYDAAALLQANGGVEPPGAACGPGSLRRRVGGRGTRGRGGRPKSTSLSLVNPKEALRCVAIRSPNSFACFNTSRRS